jgi:GNAT superfamily N-acetyltransferase
VLTIRSSGRRLRAAAEREIVRPKGKDVSMRTIDFRLLEKTEFTENHRTLLADMLREQGKVQGDLSCKIDRCRFLCVADVDDQPAAIGAIKEMTKSDFDSTKADLPALANEFQWELGYLFTRPAHEGKGLASQVVRMLLSEYGEGPIMASTEVCMNPRMVRILEKNGFRTFGKPWKSGIHDNMLGLFLRMR